MAVRTSCAAVLLLIGIGIYDPGLIDLTLPAGVMALLLGSMLLGGVGDLAFVRAVSIEDVSRAFTVSSSLYILFSVAGGVLFTGEPFSFLLVAGGAAVLFGTRLVVADSTADSTDEATNGTNRRPREPRHALRLAVLAALLWAAALLTISDALEKVGPVTAAGLRLPFFAVALVLNAGVRGDLALRSAGRHDMGTLALSGTLVLGSMLLFLAAADLAPAGLVAVLTSTSPMFAVPLAHFLLKERLTLRNLTGIAACMAGIVMASSA
jgi:drug/metabolite transporter (DMT)-like permease